MDDNAFWDENNVMENVLPEEISNMIIYQDVICLGVTTNDELK